MLTAAVRDLHACYPGEFQTDVRTTARQLWEHNPHVTRLDENDPNVSVLPCHYPLIHESNHGKHHFSYAFMDFLNRQLGLSIRPTAPRGDIHLSAEEKAWFSQVHDQTDSRIPFWIVVAGGKYDYTIKWWDPMRYQEVIDHFRGRIQFVQVGERGHYHPPLRHVIDLRGKTDIRQLVRLVYHAHGVLCGVTFAMHLAAAVEFKAEPTRARPCVVIAGGREPPQWEAYPGHQFIHTLGQLPCCATGGCWKARTLPLLDGDEKDKPENLCVKVVGILPKCMSMITAEDVINRIESYLGPR